MSYCDKRNSTSLTFLMFLLNLLIMNIEQCRFQATMIEKKDT